MTNPWHGRLPAMITRCTGARAEPLPPRGKSPRPHVATLGRGGHQTVTKPRDARDAETRARCWPPPSLAAPAGVGLRAGTARHSRLCQECAECVGT